MHTKKEEKVLLLRQKIQRNLLEIKQGGGKVLIEKIKGKTSQFFNYLLAPLAIILAIFAKIISLFIPVRIQRIDIGRIGHIYPSFSYLARKKMGHDLKRALDFFYYESSTGIVSNQQLKKMLTRELSIYPFARLLFLTKEWGKKLFGPETFTLGLPSYQIQDKKWLEYRYQNNFPIMNFTQQEISHCEAQLKKMGIPENADFICFHLRDSAYLNSIAGHQKWDYHDYRDATLANYVEAMEKFTKDTGLYALRMGAITKDKITKPIPRVIDYANSEFRNDLMDMYLSYRSKFFVASDSGMSVFPEMMGKHILFFNIAPVARLDPWGHYVIYLPKKFYWNTENRYLTYDEVIHKFIGIHPSTEKFEQHNIRVDENTSEEMYQGLHEMNQILEGTFVRTDDDIQLQKRFWEIRGKMPRGGKTLFIGTNFLRQYRDLIE